MRARRFAHLAEGNPLKPYLTFLAALSACSGTFRWACPPSSPWSRTLWRAPASTPCPPLDRNKFTADTAFEATFERLLAEARAIEMPDAARAALDAVKEGGVVGRELMIRNVLADAIPWRSWPNTFSSSRRLAGAFRPPGSRS